MKGQTRVNLIVIAYRNLYRHKVKSIITISAVAISVLLYIFMDAWLYGMNIDSQRNIINFETGSVKIYNKAFFEKKDEVPTYESFNTGKEIVNRLKENGWNAAQRVVFTGSLISVEQEVLTTFIGIDNEDKNSVLSYVVKGEFVKKGQFKSAWKYSTIVYCIIGGTLISALTALSPVLRTLKTSIIDALRFE